MEKNIFEGAKYGDRFLTRDCDIAIYFSDSGNLKECVILGHNGIYEYDEYGKDLYETYDLPSDIVSRYYKPIDEEKVNALVHTHIDQWGDTLPKTTMAWVDGFKVGYREGKEE